MSPYSFSLGLVVNVSRSGAEQILTRVRSWAAHHDVSLILGDIGFGYPPGDEERVPVKEMAGRCDVLLVIGGDGTILRVAPLVAPLGIPLVAINTGDFGFLATAEAEEIDDLLGELKSGDLREEERHILRAQYGKKETTLALNDIVVHRGEVAGVIKLEVSVDDVLVSRFAADGVIVSTPTGSTAYGLSAGGPVFHPSVDALAIIPLCAHTLSVRPVVVSKHAQIKIRAITYTGGNVHILSDGRIVSHLGVGDSVTVQRSENTVRLLLRKERSFYDVLRTKLGWAGPQAVRNDLSC